MSSFDELSLKNSKAKKIAMNAMQERLGKKSDLQEELEHLEALIDADVETFMGRDTPPPDYLMEEAKTVWKQILHNAPEMHFRQTEYDLIAQYCWNIASVKHYLGSSGMAMEIEELAQLQKLQVQARMLAVRLRLSPQLGITQKTQDRILTAKQTAEGLKGLVEGRVGAKRSRLMFGGEDYDVQ
jgi:phage terminase small subunit